MNLWESYDRIKESIVALTPKYIPVNNETDPPPEFPQIIATGFVINEAGLIVTNDHVVETIPKLFRPIDKADGQWPLNVHLFKITEAGMLKIPLEVLGVFKIDQFITSGEYYGPKRPDIALVLVKAKGLPALELDDCKTLSEGIEVATAGFPMGTDALVAPGWLHQVTPTLQKGIISAILPFNTPKPHAFSINVMTQGGASGSPVFLPENGKIIGILYAGLNDIDNVSPGGDIYTKPTNISYVVPSYYLFDLLEKIKSDPNLCLPPDTKSIEEMIASGDVVNSKDYRQSLKIQKIKPIAKVERNIQSIDLSADESDKTEN